MKSWAVLTAVFLVLVLVAATCSSVGLNPPVPPARPDQKAAGGAQQIIMKFGHGAEQGNPRQLGATKFANLVRAKSNGRMVVEVYNAGSLGTDEQMVEQLQSGVSQFAAPGSGTVATLEPKLSVLDMPFRFRDFQQAWDVLDGPLGRELVANLPQKGLRVLGYWENGFRYMTNNKHPINTPDDLKGLKMRVPNWEVSIATFKALGARVTALPWPEVYMALQHGDADGQENPYAAIAGGKLYEVQKYLSVTRHQCSPLTIVVSEKFWKTLSTEDQEIIQGAVKEAGAYQRNLVKDSEARLLADLEAKGMQVSTPADMKPFRDRVASVYEEYRPRVGDVLQKLLDETR